MTAALVDKLAQHNSTLSAAVANAVEPLHHQVTVARDLLAETQRQNVIDRDEAVAKARKEVEDVAEANLNKLVREYLGALEVELTLQSRELERRWSLRAKEMVDKERDGRLARLDR